MYCCFPLDVLQCEENYGMFVRVTQLTLLDEDGNPLDPAAASPEEARSRLSR